jgi:hypothetical protein
MTNPIKTKTVVTENIHRSTLTRLAIENPFHHGEVKTRNSFPLNFAGEDDWFGSSEPYQERFAAVADPHS